MCCRIFIWLWYRGNAGLVKWLWMCFLCFSFLRRVGIKCFWNTLVKPSSPGIFFFGDFWLLIQCHYSLFVCSDFLSSRLSLVRLYVPRNLFIFYRFCWCIIFCSSLLWSLYFCGVNCHVLYFIYNFICVFSLFCSLTEDLSVLSFSRTSLSFDFFLLFSYSLFSLYSSFPSFC